MDPVLPRNRYCTCSAGFPQDTFLWGLSSKTILTQQAVSWGRLGDREGPVSTCLGNRELRVFLDWNAFETYLSLGLQIKEPTLFICGADSHSMSLLSWEKFLWISSKGPPRWGCLYHWTSDRFWLPLQGTWAGPWVGGSWFIWENCDFRSSGKSQNRTNSSASFTGYIHRSLLVTQAKNDSKQNNTKKQVRRQTSHWYLQRDSV